jgi:hypothetical protein
MFDLSNFISFLRPELWALLLKTNKRLGYQKQDERDETKKKVMRAVRAKLKARREYTLANMCIAKFQKGRITPLRVVILKHYKSLALWEFSEPSQDDEEEDEDEEGD